MKFILDAEQRLFGETLDKLLAQAGTPAVARDWAAGRPEPGLALWRSLAEAGLFAVAVPERAGGAGVLPVELVTAFHELGRHGVPGPYAETVAAAVLLDRLSILAEGPAEGAAAVRRSGAAEGTPDAPSSIVAEGTADAPSSFLAEGRAEAWLPGIAEGTVVASLALPPLVPYALDADVASVVLTVEGDELRTAAPGQVRESLDPARRLFPVVPGDVLAAGPEVASAAGEARDLGTLACAAQLVGVGRRLLEVSVDYAGTRRQFGRPIGEFQAVKHHLANALVELEYARPLVHGAALAYGSPDFSHEVSAAKAMASDAAYGAARIALQVHGAIGYTDEYDPSLLIRKARALRAAWGSPADHRARVMSALTGP
ncbi:acyl-CoA dehydrogenase family protein [Nonomuraea cavernae]|uniref:Acyl-CoA dehydrogenase FadE n=1 Tax=Nonomuraea cavernae TaxID=2045107 RepID=A0A917Z375_9ACTN|nr:acyl-CoA dehydrogenase family protein [Nonomuraea cavernae]MCA2188067.1 acyl-CoA/acyl-ACP dehydrogenase [Nonomuraea cavernae]GGO72709.1 putative acyl-CoA dehydrogenase FadE [Nonomuraea cavernae]